jgi:hypothetical protein
MICYSLAIYRVEPAKSFSFVALCRGDGLRHALARQTPGYLATSILLSSTDPCEYLVLEFWMSATAFQSAESFPMFAYLSSLLSDLSKSSKMLGMFCFPAEAAHECLGTAEVVH